MELTTDRHGGSEESRTLPGFLRRHIMFKRDRREFTEEEYHKKDLRRESVNVGVSVSECAHSVVAAFISLPAEKRRDKVSAAVAGRYTI